MARFDSDNLFFVSYLITHGGTHLFWPGFGSSFLKALYYLDRSLPSSPSSSFVGFGLSFSLKVDATYDTALLIVPSAKVS